MSACVSPPHERVSHMVEVAAIMAQAASTAFPPCSKIFAPAVAASGLPVPAIECGLLRAPFRMRAAEDDAGAHQGVAAVLTRPLTPSGSRGLFFSLM